MQYVAAVGYIICRLIRVLAWLGLVVFACYTVSYLEKLVVQDRLGLPQLVFSLTELVAGLCIALGADRFLDMVEPEKPNA